jgi:hypothetical protein
MEVHAHTHTARKKWTHYFWEFLMLFLAVFCGFLAEYQLEHKIEKERGLQYIRSFYDDLTTDTAEFSRITAAYEWSLNVLKNRKECYDSIKNDPACTCLVSLFNYSFGFADLINADQTLLQLKNAGGLRLLNKEDADSILLYDKRIRMYIKNETTGFQETQTNIRNVIHSLNNYEWSSAIKDNKKIPVIFSESQKELLNRYFNLLDQYYNDSRLNIKSLNRLHQKAAGLIEYFKQKYHFN